MEETSLIERAKKRGVIPTYVFVCGGILSLVLGIYLISEISFDVIPEHLQMLYLGSVLALILLIPPALFIYPLLRLIFAGGEDSLFVAFLSAVFGAWVEHKVKQKISKTERR